MLHLMFQFPQIFHNALPFGLNLPVRRCARRTMDVIYRASLEPN